MIKVTTLKRISEKIYKKSSDCFLSGNWKKYKKDQVLCAAVFLFTALLIIGVFVIYPVFNAAYTSLTSWNGFTPTKTFIGFANYVRLFHDPEFWNSLLVTIIYALGVCIFSVVTGLLLALLLDAPIRGLSIYRSIYFLPVVTSSVAAAIVWKYMLDPSGFINGLLALIGVKGPDWLQNRWLALGALTLLTVWKNLGFNAILYLTALQALPKSVYEAASIDGADGYQKLKDVTFPLLAPMTFFVVIQALVTSFQAFDLAYVLTGGGPRGGTEVLGMLMYRDAFKLGDFGYGTAIAFMTLALVLFVTWIQWKFTGAEGR